MTFPSVDELLADARSRLQRLMPTVAAMLVADGQALLVDIRPQWQRARDGEIPGALVVERNHLEWRLHPASDARIVEAVHGQRWIVICEEGYTSSLAADALNSIGVPATDIEGGVRAWRSAGLPTVVSELTLPDQIVGGSTHRKQAAGQPLSSNPAGQPAPSTC
jgi:rhodanese-related sulfurtransferase